MNEKTSDDIIVGENCTIAEDIIFNGFVKIGNNCKIGNKVVLDSVSIGDDTVIEDNSIIGYGTITGHYSPQTSPDDSKLTNSKYLISIGNNVLVRTGVVIYFGATIGNNCWINHNAIIREKSDISDDTSIGINVVCENDVSIGKRCVIHNNCMICAQTQIESFVFVGPGVTFTNNSPIGHLRNVPDTLRGAKLRLGCAIGGGVTICPGVEIGTEAIVAAGSTVTKDIPSRIVVAGNPAKKLKDVDANSYIKDSIRQQYEI